ncbi:hypothetical protein V6N13_090119 [Hibiscus sabdariffa]
MYVMTAVYDMESLYYKGGIPVVAPIDFPGFFDYIYLFMAGAIPFLASSAGLVYGISFPITLAYPQLHVA